MGLIIGFSFGVGHERQERSDLLKKIRETEETEEQDAE